ncbi:hypothetical protein Ae406Ps2_1143 [Pseudonocardia sp. Ae406_Ps2]|uniref:DUF222 domain-containing protein n=1 Tax=unclassified Pseudonocardia TaxID=2619320 RepID=UPI00094B0F39|nr:MULTISPECIES: DUF222 domain-containing protein [unclassified Pseudonocardia]OLM01143.1 hypothetical protein Ae406Ps2_1143 [Pseudonocardia sp. Ae406_Ps2]OLM07062.1 hypothetical protein Ae331Ps2_4772c [Pseudonocardia sp. Ae331_Ps2]OLM22721.1 hypothetical protein Ae706Ps2_1153 [Pseudonocardia sp. Ae706_Ps2]
MEPSAEPITPAADPGPLPLDLHELESELLGLAGHIAAAECRFLRLLAEFDDRGGWCGVGVRSCAHWLTWRAGMSLRTATEHLRVAHALTRLPRITEAFAAGRISYSKVRAITRLAGAEDSVLARLTPTPTPAAMPHTPAPCTTAASPHLDADATTDPRPGDDSTTRSAGDDPGTSPVTDSHQGLVSSSPAGHTDGTDPAVHGTDDTPPAPERPTGAPVPGAHGPSPASAPPPAEQVLLDLALTGTASHVESVVRAARRRLAPPATTAALRGVSWYHDSDGSLVLRARLTPDDGAALVAAIEAHVVAVAPSTAAPSTEPDPRVGPHERAREAAEHAPGAVVDTLAARRADALLDLVTREGDDEGGPVVSRPGTRVTVVDDATTGSARLDGGPEIPAPTAERLACDARARVLLTDRHANHLYLGRSRRLAGPSQIAALSAAGAAEGRPGCRFPGCAHTRHLHAHHVRHWLHGGPTDIDNLVLLCSFHHRLVHDHGYVILRPPGGTWTVHRPDGTVVRPTGAPLDGSAETLLEINTRARLRIDRDTLTPDWYGDRLDPGPILDALLPPDTASTAAA